MMPTNGCFGNDLSRKDVGPEEPENNVEYMPPPNRPSTGSCSFWKLSLQEDPGVEGWLDSSLQAFERN